jgi:hypothetical protein
MLRITRAKVNCLASGCLASGKVLTAVASEGGGIRSVVAPWQKVEEQKWELLKVDPAKLTT